MCKAQISWLSKHKCCMNHEMSRGVLNHFGSLNHFGLGPDCLQTPACTLCRKRLTQTPYPVQSVVVINAQSRTRASRPLLPAIGSSRVKSTYHSLAVCKAQTNSPATVRLALKSVEWNIPLLVAIFRSRCRLHGCVLSKGCTAVRLAWMLRFPDYNCLLGT